LSNLYLRGNRHPKFGGANKALQCSTGGEASIELLQGKTLAGFAALLDK
jgi:3-phosphoglycerate kinase